METSPSNEQLYDFYIDFKKNSCFPPGHFYSPIVDVSEIRKRQFRIWKSKRIDGIKGIDLNKKEQLKLLGEMSVYYPDIPFEAKKKEGIRYNFENDMFSYSDGISLYFILRHYKPTQVIEIGSGYSSALMLDVNQLYFENKIALTFIEPYPDRLYSLLSEEDRKNTKIITQQVQSIDMADFSNLDKGDILFIDSSHVAKCGSDVNYILFEILPTLKSGVLIHIHDIFYPFEYPREWVLEGRNWNENYFIKSFLLYNDKFKIKLFNNYLHIHHKKAFGQMPLFYKNKGGSLWLEKK